jgi:Histidine kinase-, DNA gyrase B-, and HSP90-like ATPase
MSNESAVPAPSDLEAELFIGPSAIDAYSRLSYSMWFALGEFVDNSTQSRLNYDGLVHDILKNEGVPLTVNIVHNRVTREIMIEDNSIGMTKEDLRAALRIAVPTADSKGRSKYGMGMKTSACWIGKQWAIVTCEWGSGEEWTASIDVEAIAHRGAKVPLTMRKVDTAQHYTRIIISDLRRVIQKRSEEVIRTYLGSMYMFDLRKDADGNPGLKLTYNGEEVPPPDESDWDTDTSGKPYKQDLLTKIVGGKTVSGWFGVLRKGGRKFGGFSLYQNNRQIQGFPNAWKPKAIFGGVDDEGANNLVAQRLTGVLLLDGFVVSHTKDAVLFEGDEEDELEKFLVEQTKDYAEYAKKRRGKPGQTWSKDKVRELVDSMKGEFTSTELKDALTTAALPPSEAIAANNQRQVKSLTAEDEVTRFEILPDLTVVVSVKEASEFEPYVVYSPGAEAGTLHVIINGLHPYYQSLSTNDAMEECIHQYLYDAIAEYKAGKLVSRVNPDSIRRLKDSLLLAHVTRKDNADSETVQKAEKDLYAGGEDSALS